MQFKDALKDAINYWNSDSIEDEWFFENFRSDYIDCMSSSEAFSSIDVSIVLLLKEKDEATGCEILQTVINLANKSQTTEIPSELSENKELIEKQFISWGEYARTKLQELFDYYRL